MTETFADALAAYRLLVQDRAQQIALGVFYDGNEIDQDIAAALDRLRAMTIWYHHGFNGSGVPLHVRVVVDEIDGERTKVRFPGADAPAVDYLGGEVQESDGRWVGTARLTDRPQDTPLASFNWLD